MFALLCASMLLAPPDASVDEIVQNVMNAGQKKIGVIPVVINRQGDREATIGSLGPRGKVLANRMYEQLVEASQKSGRQRRFQVVPERVMRAALANRSLSDLSVPRKLQELAENVGDADGFVILTVDEDTATVNAQSVTSGAHSTSGETNADDDGKTISLNGNVEVIRPGDATVTSETGFQDTMTITKAAYQGESWELRRWEKGSLANTGLDMDGPGAFAAGEKSEQQQYVRLKKGLPHPALDQTFPYPIALKVEGSIREPQDIAGRAVIELNEGEEYTIMVQNDSDRDVYVALYVDGVNSINQQLVEPEKLDTKSHWYLAARSGKREIKGWFEITRDSRGQPTGQQTYKTFRVLESSGSVAAVKGFHDNIGMVTAIFYTVGMTDVPKGTADRSYGGNIVGTGEGQAGTAKLKFKKGTPRGVMLASLTLYYRTKDQLQEIQSGTSDDLLFVNSKTGNQSEAITVEETLFDFNKN